MGGIKLKSEEDIKKLRKSGKILSNTLHSLKNNVKPGIKLGYLDQKAKKFIRESGGEPAFLGYKPAGAKNPYPSSICASVNEEIVHGLPNKKIRDGDLLTIDIGVKYEGMITDSALTVGVGSINDQAERLIEVTKKTLLRGVKMCRPGGHVGDIGFAIESCVKEHDLRIIKNLTGHGVGFDLHEKPTILNYGEKNTGAELKKGLVIAVEPMVSISSDIAKQREDGSFVTSDGSLSAHFEVTLVITDEGREILTPLRNVVK